MTKIPKNRMSVILAPVALIALSGCTAVAEAAASFQVATGRGYVLARDVQIAFGWSDAVMAKRGRQVSFHVVGRTVYE